jgi:hypothetical protein
MRLPNSRPRQPPEAERPARCSRRPGTAAHGDDTNRFLATLEARDFTSAAATSAAVRRHRKRHKLEIWCPIEDRLAVEMATWDRLGRYVPTSVHHLKRLLRQQKEHIPELADVTFHGLRATRVVELRRAGLQPTQIGSVVGMSSQMIERYCRFSNAKENSEAAVAALRRLER